MAISDELKAIYVTAPNDDHYVETLTLAHPLFPGGYRYLTNYRGGFQGQLETGDTVQFLYVPFAAVPPENVEYAQVSLKVAIDNSSRELMDELEILGQQPTVPIAVIYRVYLESDFNTVQNDPPLLLTINSVTAEQHAVTFNAGTVNLYGKPFPSMLYSTDLFPALKR